MIIENSKVEFDLTVRKYGRKDERGMYDRPYREEGKEPKLEVLESLSFKSLSAVEVIRKLLDYIR